MKEILEKNVGTLDFVINCEDHFCIDILYLHSRCYSRRMRLNLCKTAVVVRLSYRTSRYYIRVHHRLVKKFLDRRRARAASG